MTSNLVVPDENTSAIQVGSDNVGIDLNDFTIRGPVICSGTPTACTPNTGTGSGVERTSNSVPGTYVSHGSIRGMGSNGVQLGVQAEVTNVRVRSNRLVGIQTGSGSAVLGNTVRIKSGFGLNLGSESSYRENVVTSNTGGTVNGTSLGNLGNNACNGSSVCP